MMPCSILTLPFSKVIEQTWAWGSSSKRAEEGLGASQGHDKKLDTWDFLYELGQPEAERRKREEPICGADGLRLNYQDQLVNPGGSGYQADLVSSWVICSFDFSFVCSLWVNGVGGQLW